MAKHLWILGCFLAVSLLCAIPLRADQFTPDYQFNGVLTVLGLNPTCGASSSPCTEAINISFQYYLDLQPSLGAPNIFILPGTLNASATGPLGAMTVGGLNENFPNFYYEQFFFPQASAGVFTEFDLNIDPTVTPSGFFGSETYFCTGECNALFGGDMGNFSVPTSLTYNVTQVPEPNTSLLILCGTLLLGLLLMARTQVKAICPD